MHILCVARKWFRDFAKIQVVQLGRDHDQYWLTEIEQVPMNARRMFEGSAQVTQPLGRMAKLLVLKSCVLSHSIPHVALSYVTFCQI